jgi:EmrB/QacA subfamily drug resistance transporter
MGSKSMPGADPRRWAALVVMLVAAFMNLLDVSIVNIAVPSIQRGLNASYAEVQWTLAGYTLGYALVLITGGRLGDAYGRKRVFLAGVAGFTLMSGLCAAARDPGMLIGCRVAQGAMGALMIPQVLSFIQVAFPPAERIKALASFGVTAGLGTVSGPLIGGLLTSHSLLGLGWRSIFLVNVPVGVIALTASARLVRESRAPSPPRLDPLGALLLTAALVLLLYPLVQGRQDGWPAWAYLMMSLSAPVLAAFTGWELARKRSPLVELRMFRQRGFAVGTAIALVFFLGVASFALVLTLFLQEGLGFAPLHAGLTFVPFSLGTFAASGAAAGLEPRFGSRVTMAGALIMVVGTIGLIGTVHHFGAAVSTWDMAPALAAAGLGLGTVIAPLANVILAGVAEQDAGSASGVLNTGFQLGSSIGLAVVGVIFFGFLGSQAAPAVASVPVRAGLIAAGLPARYAGPVTVRFGDCLHDRLVASDPTITPPACRTEAVGVTLPAAAEKVLTASAGVAVKRDFTAATERTLWYQAGVFALAFVLMLALPAGPRRTSGPRLAQVSASQLEEEADGYTEAAGKRRRQAR